MGKDNLRVAIVGAGIIGLSTGLSFAQAHPNAHITLLAEHFLEGTTSFVSGGVFGPTVERAPLKDEALLKRWTVDTGRHFYGLATGADAAISGVTLQNLLEYFDWDRKEMPFFSDYVVHCRWMSKEELAARQVPSFVKSGVDSVTTITECRFYLPYMLQKLQNTCNSLAVVQRKVQSFDELAKEGYDLVFNCSGMGAGKLCNDADVYGVRGQVIRVIAPWVKQAIYGPPDTYIFPCRDSLLLGGVYQPDNTNTAVSAEDRHSILSRTQSYMPSLWGAKIVEEWVGFRPTRRSGTRLELEHFPVASKLLPVLHNYGHSSNGVGLSWGSGVHAAELAREHLRMRSARI